MQAMRNATRKNSTAVKKNMNIWFSFHHFMLASILMARWELIVPIMTINGCFTVRKAEIGYILTRDTVKIGRKYYDLTYSTEYIKNIHGTQGS